MFCGSCSGVRCVCGVAPPWLPFVCVKYGVVCVLYMCVCVCVCEV